MSNFLHTSDTIPDGLGWTHFCPMHLAWIIGAVAFALVVSLLYRRSDEKQRAKIRKVLAVALLADELYKMVCLFIGGNYTPSYLPLHLCSINIIFIAIHAWKPSKLLDNFLYGICTPVRWRRCCSPLGSSCRPPASCTGTASRCMCCCLPIRWC